MISSMNIEEQANKNFGRQRRWAAFGRMVRWVVAWARRCCSVAEREAIGFAACFSEELSGVYEPTNRGKDKRGRVLLGSREVEVSKVVGSVGRCREFDEDFRPLKRSLGSRWRGVYGALAGGKVLPAVKLLKVGERYFVEDGNHRVSVARHLGMQVIDAEVKEILPAETSSDSADTLAGLAPQRDRGQGCFAVRG